MYCQGSKLEAVERRRRRLFPVSMERREGKTCPASWGTVEINGAGGERGDILVRLEPGNNIGSFIWCMKYE